MMVKADWNIGQICDENGSFLNSQFPATSARLANSHSLSEVDNDSTKGNNSNSWYSYCDWVQFEMARFIFKENQMSAK